MGFNRRKRDPFGPRFGELMGKSCHAALTASARKDRGAYDKEVANIYQMLDSIEEETCWTPVVEDVVGANTGPVEDVSVVATESKPAEEGTGSPSAPVEGPTPPRKPVGTPPSPNKRKKRSRRTKGAGVNDTKPGS